MQTRGGAGSSPGDGVAGPDGTTSHIKEVIARNEAALLESRPQHLQWPYAKERPCSRARSDDPAGGRGRVSRQGGEGDVDVDVDEGEGEGEDEGEDTAFSEDSLDDAWHSGRGSSDAEVCPLSA